MSEPTDRDKLREEVVERVRDQLADGTYPHKLATEVAVDAIAQDLEEHRATN